MLIDFITVQKIPNLKPVCFYSHRIAPHGNVTSLAGQISTPIDDLSFRVDISLVNRVFLAYRSRCREPGDLNDLKHIS